VAKYLNALPYDQREQVVVDAIKVGVFCLERARAGQDVGFPAGGGSDIIAPARLFRRRHGILNSFLGYQEQVGVP